VLHCHAPESIPDFALVSQLARKRCSRWITSEASLR
jgi:hypothetical protein